MSEHNGHAEVAGRFLAAFGARDEPALRALLAEDIVWSMPGSGTISGTVRGRDAAVARAWEIAGRGVHTELRHVLVGQHGAALSLHNTAHTPDGRVLDEHLATVLTISDGVIAAIDSYLSDVDGMSAFFV
ncbi:nuclear transport factor 2 family protein [Kitasatospora sp. NPDC085879]|uniref:nuclear transport factor 2 family protein n=1 Tax=Kitasatospora sp. NPDC085879 TaxID=3154769 RepID=UPI00341F96B1